MSAPQRLASALQKARNSDAEQHSTQATVTAVQATTVTVSIDGVESDWPFLASSYTPTVGDTVWCVGPPGSWVVIGSVSGVAPQTATTQTADDLVVNHDITAGHNIVADAGIRSNGGLSAGGAFAVTGGSTFSADIDATPARLYINNVSIRGNSIWNYDRDGALRWDATGALEVVTRDGTGYRGVYASNFAPPPSWRRYKLDQRALAEFLGSSPGDVIDGLDVGWSWTYDPAVVSFADGTERIGPKLDEMPDGLIVRSVDEKSGEDRSSWDLAGMITVLVAEVQALRKRVSELEEGR